MRAARTAAILGSLLALGLQAAELPESITIGPYLTHLGRDRVTISWRTHRPTSGRIEYYVRAEERREHKDDYRAVYHDVTLTGLPPGAECRYRVVVGDEATPLFRFSTAPAGPTAFRFAKYGDSGTNPEQHRRVAMAIRKHKPAFVIHTGDFVPQGDTGRRWRAEFFEPARELLAECPLFPTIGDNDLRAIKSYCDYFRIPRKQLWYAWQYGDCEFFALNPYGALAADSPQGRWLAEALAASTARWKVVALQEPPYSCGLHGSHHGVRASLLPLLFKHGVDLVLAGGDHSYERTHAIGSGPDPSANAIVHIISGGGGQRLYPVFPQCWTAHAVSKHHFCIVDVDGDQMTIAAYSDGNELLDRVAMSKKNGARAFGKTLAAEEVELMAHSSRFGAFRFPPLRGRSQSQQFEFTVRNPFKRGIQGELAWEIRNEAWAIDPPRQTIQVPPGREAKVAFEVSYTPRAQDPPVEPLPQAILTSGRLRATVPAFAIERGRPTSRRR
jgi:hypothetical protein